MLNARAWLFSLLVATLALSGVAVPAQALAHESATAPTPAGASADFEHPPVDLGDDVGAQVGARGAAKWNTTRLYYYETIPSGWDWSLSTAVAKWNQSGGRIKLVRTAYRSRAKLLISYGNTYGSDGYATIGATAHPWVHLSTAYRHKSTTSAYNRVLLVDIFAHELGHVLGFNHVSSACSLMTPIIDIVACGLLPAAHPGYYKCQIIDRSTVVRFIRLYGGTAHYAPGWCLIDPMPQTLSGVVFSGGTPASSPVKIAWTKPTRYPSGSRVRIQAYNGTTCAASTLRSTTYASLTALSWLDRAADTSGPTCFRVALVNRYGVARSTRTSVLDRWITPPPVPVVGSTATWNSIGETFDFTASVASGAVLVGQWDDSDPTVCPTTRDPNAPHEEVWVANGKASITAPAPTTCLAFFALKASADLASPLVTRTWTVPLPSHTPVVGAPYAKPSWGAGTYAAKVTGVSGVSVAVAVVPGACPQTIPDESWQPTQVTEVATEYTFSVEQAVSCVAFAERDKFGRLGPVATRTFTVAPPTHQVVVAAPHAFSAWGEGAFATTVTGVPADSLGMALLPGACPGTIPADSWEGAYATGGTNEYGFFALQEGTNCVAFAERDQFGRVGPVVTKPFTYTP